MMQNKKKQRTHTQWGSREAAAPLGAPRKAAPLCSVFLIVSYHSIFLYSSNRVYLSFARPRQKSKWVP